MNIRLQSGSMSIRITPGKQGSFGCFAAPGLFNVRQAENCSLLPVFSYAKL